MLVYHSDVIALEHTATDRHAHVLRRHGVAKVTLTHSPNLPTPDRGGAGLVHTAVVF